MIKKAVTHNGSFHADDVFVAAVLTKLFPKIRIRRTRNEKEIATADIVFDVGRIYDPAMLRFDHHQPDAPKRGNGVPYCSFGQIWQKYGEQYCGDLEIAKRIDEKLIQPIDAEDNGMIVTEGLIAGVTPMTWDENISIFNPRLFDNADTVNKQFKKAVNLAGEFLERMVEKEKDDSEKIKYVAEMIKKSPDERYVILEKDANYRNIASDHPKLLYVVVPNETNNSWGMTALRDDNGKLRKPLPADWAGKVDQELAKVTGVSDAVFAHTSRFCVVAGSHNGILELLEKTLN